jgi:non-specific serine/threonine protein kinase
MLRLVASLGQYWWLRGELTEGRSWLERALARVSAAPTLPEPDATFRRARATAQLHLGVIARRQGDYATARLSLSNALTGFDAIGDATGHATALLHLGVTTNVAGDHVAAARYLEQSLAAHRELGFRYGVTLALLQLALIAFWQGDEETAWARAQENLAAYADPTDRNRESTLWLAGVLAINHGDFANARNWLAESLSLIVNAGDADILHFVIEGFAVLAAAEGQTERALKIAGAAQHIRDLSASRLPPRWQERTAAIWERAREAISVDDAEDAWDAGMRLTRDEVMTLVLDTDDSARSNQARSTLLSLAQPPAPIAMFTRREREVLALVVRGLSNRGIADTLSIGERTVETHVANLLGKVGLASRGQFIAWAAAQGLLSGAAES